MLMCRKRNICTSFDDVKRRYCGGMEHQQGSKRPEALHIECKASEVRADGTLIELVYDPDRRVTSFVVSQDGKWRFEPSLELGKNHRIVPFSPDNNLIRTGALVLPSKPEEYGS